MNSAIRIGNPIMMVKAINNKKNAPPPLVPVIYGNFQIAPRPMAAPADERINPKRDVHCCFFCMKLCPLFCISLLYNSISIT